MQPVGTERFEQRKGSTLALMVLLIKYAKLKHCRAPDVTKKLAFHLQLEVSSQKEHFRLCNFEQTKKLAIGTLPSKKAPGFAVFSRLMAEIKSSQSRVMSADVMLQQNFRTDPKMFRLQRVIL